MKISKTCLAIGAVCCAWSTSPSALASPPVMEAIESSQEDQLNFLIETVNINSGTHNIEGVRRVGAMFAQRLEDIGFTTEWVDMPPEMGRAGHLLATRSFGDGPNILLIGHIDTVFSPESEFQRAERTDDGIRGPGIVDMKGGITTIIYSLEALVKADALKKGRITIFLAGDEEDIGQPISQSRHKLRELSKTTDYALGFEDGAASEIVVGRRGISGWSLHVSGVQAHSSRIFGDQVGAGASFEMARVLSRFYKEVRGPSGLTFNPGILISGSSILSDADMKWDLRVQGKSNVVTDEGRAFGAIRFMSDEQYERAKQQMSQIVADSLPNTSSQISFEDAYPAMNDVAGNYQLLGFVKSIHEALGLAPASPANPVERGAADISFVEARFGALDGLGVTGPGRHSENEVLKVESLASSTKRAALLVLALVDMPLPQSAEPEARD